MEKKTTTCILFKSVFDAAKELADSNQPDLALDILLSYGKYAFGYTDKVEAKSLVAELVVMQNVPLLDAVAKKYNAKVEKQKTAKPATKKDAIYQYAKENRENPTPAENRFKKFLSKNKIEYRFQVPVRCGSDGYIIDFVVHSKSLKKDIAIEIDGGYHNDPEQIKKDKIREDNLKESGYEVVRFKNEETEKDAIYDVLFRKMNHIGAADILNKITIKKYLN